MYKLNYKIVKSCWPRTLYLTFHAFAESGGLPDTTLEEAVDGQLGGHLKALELDEFPPFSGLFGVLHQMEKKSPSNGRGSTDGSAPSPVAQGLVAVAVAVAARSTTATTAWARAARSAPLLMFRRSLVRFEHKQLTHQLPSTRRAPFEDLNQRFQFSFILLDILYSFTVRRASC